MEATQEVNLGDAAAKDGSDWFPLQMNQELIFLGLRCASMGKTCFDESKRTPTQGFLQPRFVCQTHAFTSIISPFLGYHREGNYFWKKTVWNRFYLSNMVNEIHLILEIPHCASPRRLSATFTVAFILMRTLERKILKPPSSFWRIKGISD